MKYKLYKKENKVYQKEIVLFTSKNFLEVLKIMIKCKIYDFLHKQKNKYTIRKIRF